MIVEFELRKNIGRYFFVGLSQDISFDVAPDLQLGVCKAKKKIQAQLSAEAQRKLADFVIENNGFSAARWLWVNIYKPLNKWVKNPTEFAVFNRKAVATWVDQTEAVHGSLKSQFNGCSLLLIQSFPCEESRDQWITRSHVIYLRTNWVYHISTTGGAPKEPLKHDDFGLVNHLGVALIDAPMWYSTNTFLVYHASKLVLKHR